MPLQCASSMQEKGTQSNSNLVTSCLITRQVLSRFTQERNVPVEEELVVEFRCLVQKKPNTDSDDATAEENKESLSAYYMFLMSDKIYHIPNDDSWSLVLV